jgi:DNA-directed RNA polymerase specialized sigma24 family protein
MTVPEPNGASLPEPFIEYICKLASYHAASLVRCGFYRWDDCEDLRQDLLVDLQRRLSRFDVSLGNPYAFAHLIIQNHASVLAVRGAKRTERATVSFDSVVRSGAGPRARFQEPRAEEFGRTNREIDLRRAMGCLPPRLKSLALDLESMSVPEISARWEKSRSWVYQMIGQIRDSLIGNGLKAEARKRATPGKSKNVRSKAKKS